MNITEFLNNGDQEKGFSFEVLPPLKGNGTAALFRTIDALKEFNPRFINITTHQSGSFLPVSVCVCSARYFMSCVPMSVCAAFAPGGFEGRADGRGLAVCVVFVGFSRDRRGVGGGGYCREEGR